MYTPYVYSPSSDAARQHHVIDREDYDSWYTPNPARILDHPLELRSVTEPDSPGYYVILMHIADFQLQQIDRRIGTAS